MKGWGNLSTLGEARGRAKCVPGLRGVQRGYIPSVGGFGVPPKYHSRAGNKTSDLDDINKAKKVEEQKMRIAIGADHGGFGLKSQLVQFVEELGHEVVDVGAHTNDPSDDYPDFARAVALNVASDRAERGIMVCGSGVGASVAANKVRGVRASVCHDTYSAHQGVEHDDMNVLCLGDRIVGVELARELVRAFVSARFSGEERHKRRLDKVLKMENDFS